MTLKLRLLSASGLVLLTTSARAQTPPPPEQHPVAIATPPAGTHTGDTVILKDGTTLHGTVREMTPGQNVTITLQDGQTRTVEWSAVERVDIDRAKAPAAQPPVATTLVHLDGARPGVVLQALDQRGTEGTWQTVCEGACDRDLPASGLYRVDGPGLRTSKPFRLEGERATYRVDTATGLGFAGGLTLVIVGGLALVNGVGFLILGAVYKSDPIYIVPDWIFVAGAALSIGGIAALIPGVFLMKSNGRTTVTAADGSLPAHVPAWREPQLPSWQPRYATFGIPLWSGAF